MLVNTPLRTWLGDSRVLEEKARVFWVYRGRTWLTWLPSPASDSVGITALPPVSLCPNWNPSCWGVSWRRFQWGKLGTWRAAPTLGGGVLNSKDSSIELFIHQPLTHYHLPEKGDLPSVQVLPKFLMLWGLLSFNFDPKALFGDDIHIHPQ